MASEFNIGPSGGLSIFTNDSEDMFKSNFNEPNFQIDSGTSQGVVDINQIQNISDGITIDFANNSPIAFDSFESPKAPQRQKFDSIISDKTIEAEPVSRGFRPAKTIPKRPKRPDSNNDFVRPEPIVFNRQNAPKMMQVEELGADANQINFGFDDLLDSSKLKPLKEDISPPANPMPEPIDSPEPMSPIDSFPGTPIRQSYGYPPSPPQYQSQNYQQTPQAPTYSYKDIPKYGNDDEERLDLLLKLKALERRKGITLTKHYGPKSSLDELRLEYNTQTKTIDTDAGIKFMRTGLIFCTSGIEYANRRFNPIGIPLDGWGENVMENIMDFDGPFERLYEKYSGSVAMEPEMELLFALGGSAFMYAMQKTLFKNAVPQFDNVLRERPGLVQEIFGAATEAARRQQVNEATDRHFQNSGPMPANAAGGFQQQGTMQPPSMNLGSILGSVMGGLGLQGGFPGMPGGGTGLHTDPLPRPVSTQDYADPPMNDIYRQMVQQEADALSTNERKTHQISSSPKGDRVIRI